MQHQKNQNNHLKQQQEQQGNVNYYPEQTL